jgi:flavin-dependent dehydrogenase
MMKIKEKEESQAADKTENKKIVSTGVAIIGGGLAGLACSIRLARKGIKVILIEKNTYPFHRVCGEYISNEALDYVKSLGVNPFDFGAVSLDKFWLSSPSGNKLELDLPLGGFGISRYTLDYELSKIAKKEGVQIWEGIFVKDVNKGREKRDERSENDGSENEGREKRDEGSENDGSENEGREKRDEGSENDGSENEGREKRDERSENDGSENEEREKRDERSENDGSENEEREKRDEGSENDGSENEGREKRDEGSENDGSENEGREKRDEGSENEGNENEGIGNENDRNENKFLIETSNGAIESQIVIGSYGKRSNLDTKLQRDFASKNFPYIGVKYHLKTDLMPDNVIALHNFWRGYCGISKIEDDKFCFCYLSHKDNITDFKKVENIEKQLFTENPFLSKILKEAEFLYEKPEIINQVSFSPKKLIEDDVLMCGDSAGMITPLCGNGMAMALHSSKILSDLLISYFDNQMGFDALKTEYQKRWNSQFQLRLKAGRTVQRFFGGRKSSELLINTFKYIPSIARKVVSLTHGKPF